MLQSEEGAVRHVWDIKIDGCDMIVAKRTHRLYILADRDVAKWLETVLRFSVTEDKESYCKAISHSDKESVASQESLLMNSRNAVGDKVPWQPQGLTWELNFEGGEEAEKTYCRENNITLCVSEDLTGADFDEQR